MKEVLEEVLPFLDDLYNRYHWDKCTYKYDHPDAQAAIGAVNEMRRVLSIRRRLVKEAQCL